MFAYTHIFLTFGPFDLLTSESMDSLILGGTQFVGLHLVEYLIKEGHKVTILNRGLSEAKLPDEVTRLTADRNDKKQVAEVLKGKSFDVVYDISGYTPNVVEDILDILDGQIGHYVLCSTTSVYAASEIRPVFEDSALDRRPEASDYAREKIACEDLLLKFHAEHGLPTTSLRLVYVYGPHNNLKQREHTFFARITHGRKLIVPGDGQRLLHFIHVDDLAAAFATVPTRKQATGQIYTIAANEMITVKGYIQTLSDIMNKEVEVIHVEPKRYEELEANVFPFGWGISSVYSNEKARRDLDWAPRYNIHDGLAMTYQWWLEQGHDKEPWDFEGEDQILSKLS